MSRRVGTVYLLHFERAYRHARHYVGFTQQPLEDRIREHQSGQGARLVQVVVDAGISFELARTWRGGRRLERRIKGLGGATDVCPICSPAALRRGVFRPPRALNPTTNPTRNQHA